MCVMLLSLLSFTALADGDLSIIATLSNKDENTLHFKVTYSGVSAETEYVGIGFVLSLPDNYSVDTSSWDKNLPGTVAWPLGQGNGVFFSIFSGLFDIEAEGEIPASLEFDIPLSGSGGGTAVMIFDWCEANAEYDESVLSDDSTLTVSVGSTVIIPSTTQTVTAALSADKTAYDVGDTVTVTAALTPSEAAKLSSGSLKFSYDTDKLTFTGAAASTAIAGAKATADNGVCTASFTTASGSEINATTEGLVLATFTFEAKKAGTASFAVSEVVAGGENAATMTTANGDGLSVTVNALPDVTTSDFGSDYKLVKYVADALPASGSAYFLGDTALTYVPAYATGDAAGKYVFVALVTAEPTEKSVTEKTGTYDTIDPASGDANTDTATNILDAQVVIYMVAQNIKAADTGYDWLNSDVNGDCVIDALDAQAIQYYVHYGQFGTFTA